MEKFDYRWFNDERASCDDEWNYITGWSNGASTIPLSNDSECGEIEYEPLYKSHNQGNDMLKHSDESTWEDLVRDVPNPDPKDPHIVVDHSKLENNNQQDLGTKDYGDGFNIAEAISDPIDVKSDITGDVATNVKVEVTTNMELKPILNESVEEPKHFLAIADKVATEEIN
ncbi:hypothetical protein PVK06_020253 [Gossypium arboreum]|uniref:Uncharacterized protein n=1 Tax=Gossypium arboreum TaxID=29729 RepID=A0ABR0PMI9_GOSAR|nr:hypothetical protein PVK06_020253 [Gossypium arboreum]